MAAAASAAAARIGAVLSDAQYFESGMVRVEDIRRLLDSSSLKDKLDAMKRIVALISLGRDASVFFPDVVKNVVAPSLDVKKLVYMYLVHYAEDKQDLALLSVNSFQKDISDPNELIRALALRVLSSIRVKVVLQIVILAIDKCAKDPSPYVRKAAVHAISKVTSIDLSSRDVLLEPLAALLNDRSLDVLGSAVAVLDEIAPDRLDLVHAHFRYLCRSLHAMGPSGQVAALALLLRYGRTHFTRQGFDKGESEALCDPDLKLLLYCAQDLLTSQHSSVILGAISVLFHLSSESRVASFATIPLLRLVASSDAGAQFVALRVAADFATLIPESLILHLSEFFVSAADGASVKYAKLGVLSRLCETAGRPGGLGSNSVARKTLLTEFETYLFSSDRCLAQWATRAMGFLAAAHSNSASAVIDSLSSVVANSTNATVVGESVTVLRKLLRFHPKSQGRTLPKLMSLLLVPRAGAFCITTAEARAAIIWLVGECYDIVSHIAPEALRLLIRGFREEAAEVKLQILSLAVKVVCWERSCMNREVARSSVSTVSAKVREQLLDCVISFGIVDCDYDVRDKSRLLKNIVRPLSGLSVGEIDTDKLALLHDSICRSGQSREDGSANLAKSHVTTHASSGACSSLDKSDVVIGSLSHIVGNTVRGCRTLPGWALKCSEASLRTEADSSSRTGGGVLETASISSVDFANNCGYSVLLGNQLGDLRSVGTPNQSSRLSLPHRVVSSPRPRDSEHFYDSATSSATDSAAEYCSSDESDEGSSDDNIASSTFCPEDETQAKPQIDGTRTKAPENQDSHNLSLFENIKSSSNHNGNDTSLIASISDTNRASPWCTVIASWNAAGLELQVRFLADAPKASASTAATQMLFRITNNAKGEYSDLSVSSATICFDEIATNGALLLSPGQSIDFHGSCNFGGRTVACSVILACGGDVCASGDVRPHVGQVLRPIYSLLLQDFEKTERSLRGMFGCSTKFCVPVQGALASGEDLAHMTKRHCRSALLQAAFLTEIGASHDTMILSPGLKSLRFAGKLPVTADNPLLTDAILVLVRLDIESPGTSIESADVSNLGMSASEVAFTKVPVTIWIGCENVVYANTLLQTLRRVVQENEH